MGKPEIEGFSCTNVMAAQILQLDVGFLLYVVPGNFPFKVFEQSFRTWISGIKLGRQESFEMVSDSA